MSGGSFNYLYNADPAELIQRIDEVRRMGDALEARGHKAAADHTFRMEAILLRTRGEIARKLEEISAVWQTLEWIESSDWGEDSLAPVVEAFENDQRS